MLYVILYRYYFAYICCYLFITRNDEKNDQRQGKFYIFLSKTIKVLLMFKITVIFVYN
ncbi:hypothetical protein Hanom_Chr16g01466571 [Helianthus anomalus]